MLVSIKYINVRKTQTSQCKAWYMHGCCKIHLLNLRRSSINDSLFGPSPRMFSLLQQDGKIFSTKHFDKDSLSALGMVSREKLLLFWILFKSSPPPFPQFGQLAQPFFNAKNVDLGDIQKDSLSKILLKGRLLALWVMYTT